MEFGSVTPSYLNYVRELPTSPEQKYKKVKHLTRGGFGNVYSASLADCDEIRFAIKSKVRGDMQGVITNIELQEIHALKTVENEDNVIKIVDIVREPGSLLIVMNLAKTDLYRIIRNKGITINPNEIRTIFQQLLRGLKGMHKYGVLHRDIKPANILVTHDGIVEIGDFGMSAQLSPDCPTTLISDVGSLWYRAPELLLGDSFYDTKVDVWAAACTATELWTRRVLFKGLENSTQMGEISQLCGFPTERSWPSVVNLKRYKGMQDSFATLQSTQLPRELLTMVGGDTSAADLLLKLFKLDPSSRISASEALEHNFFISSPVQADIKRIIESDRL